PHTRTPPASPPARTRYHAAASPLRRCRSLRPRHRHAARRPSATAPPQPPQRRAPPQPPQAPPARPRSPRRRRNSAGAPPQPPRRAPPQPSPARPRSPRRRRGPTGAPPQPPRRAPPQPPQAPPARPRSPRRRRGPAGAPLSLRVGVHPAVAPPPQPLRPAPSDGFIPCAEGALGVGIPGVALLLLGHGYGGHEGGHPPHGSILRRRAAPAPRRRAARRLRRRARQEAALRLGGLARHRRVRTHRRRLLPGLSRGGIAEDVGWARERKAKSKLPLSWGSCFSRFFSPLGMVPVIALAGLGLFERGFPVIGTCVEIGLPMLVLFVALSQYLKHVQVCHFPILERFSVLISIALVWLYAHILTVSGAYKHSSQVTQLNCRTDRANLITTMPWFDVPYPLQWGPPTFSADHSFGMMAAVVVSLVEVRASPRKPLKTLPRLFSLLIVQNSNLIALICAPISLKFGGGLRGLPSVQSYMTVCFWVDCVLFGYVGM
ncbi:uncharacterized protein, partial [Miscanthus floridulus]|uniref:uncharacterized protein n=1 Tax=Miscanthus floridulus TaxID=154761 RepID=UPI0034595CD8